MDRRVHQVGGLFLILAGLAGVVAGALHPFLPGASALAEMSVEWRVSQIVMGIGGALFVISTLFLSRHFSGAVGEGWALIGTATLLFGGLALTGVAIWNFSELLAQQGSGSGMPDGYPLLSHAFITGPVAATIGWLLPISVAAYGVAIAMDSRWPRWLGWAGVVVGLGCLSALILEAPLGSYAALPLVLSYNWFTLLGVMFARDEGAAVVARVAVSSRPVRALDSRLEEAVHLMRRVTPALEYIQQHGFADPDEEVPAAVAQNAAPSGALAESAVGEGISVPAGSTNGSPVAANGTSDGSGDPWDSHERSDDFQLTIPEIPLLLDSGEPRGRSRVAVPKFPVRFEFAVEEEEEALDRPAEARGLTVPVEVAEPQSHAFYAWLSGPL